MLPSIAEARNRTTRNRTTRPTSEPSPPARTALLWMTRAFAVWFFVYLFAQGQDGVFAASVDHVDATWIKLLFLNIPLQLGLALVAMTGLHPLASKKTVRMMLGVAIVNALLIAIHVAISLT